RSIRCSSTSRPSDRSNRRSPGGMGRAMSQPDWNERYASGDVPWDTGEPDELLVGLVASGAVAPRSRAVEIGCGTGTNALWLARQGFDVVACDISKLAIERARAKLA